jgi:hypothetical protein
VPTGQIYAMVINAHARRGNTGTAIRCAWLHLVYMRIRIESTERFGKCCLMWLLDCDRWYERMIAAGLQPDDVTFGTVINAFARQGATGEAIKWCGISSPPHDCLLSPFCCVCVCVCMLCVPVCLPSACCLRV